MAIRFPKPPESVVTAARRLSVGDRWSFAKGALEELGGAKRPPAQPVFTAGLEALVASDGDVERVAETPTSWRYASELGGGSRAVVFVTEGRAGEARATRMGDDRFTKPIGEALAVAQGDSRVSAGDFEARLLRVPALKLLAVWLHAAGTEDIFVPVVPTAVDAAPGRLYDAPDFRSRLREASFRTLTLYEQADRPNELGG
jgi:hypothetical protein